MSDGISRDGARGPRVGVPDQPRPRFGKRRAIVLCVLSAALLAVSIWLLLTLPVRASLLHLQWAGSAATANAIVRQGPGPYRAALDRDFLLTALYTVGLVAAGYLGRQVFWTNWMQAAARVGMIAAVTAGLSNVAQDVLLLIALSHQPMTGVWLFRGAEAFSFVKFSTLLIAIGIGLIALTTTASRAWLARRTKERWTDAAVQTGQQQRRPAARKPEDVKPEDFTFAPRIRKLHEQAGLQHSGQELWPEVRWGDGAQPAGDADKRAGAVSDQGAGAVADQGAGAVADQHWVIGSSYPFPIDWDEVGICASGGGIRSATVTLGALQSLRGQAPPADGDGLSELERARYLVSVSGGGYTTSALQLGMHAADQAGSSERPQVFAPGSIEEDHLRRHSSYISDTFGQWVVALGVLLRCVVTGLALIGLTVTVLGLAIGAFYSHIPVIPGRLASLRPLFLVHTTIKGGKVEQPAPHWPGLPLGVTLAVLAALVLTVLAYLAGLSLTSRYGEGANRASTAARHLLGLTGLLLAIGVAIPALIWLGAWLTWHPHFSPKTAITTGTLAGTLSYFGAVAATLWHKKAGLSTSSGSKTGLFSRSTGGQVLPSSMVQMLLLWLCLLVLVLAAFLGSGWVATSGLPASWWALLPVGVLLFAAIFIDESWLSLHPFYRRRLATAFAIPWSSNGAGRGAGQHRDELNPLSTFAARMEHCHFPEVKFAASANISSQDRTPPGRRAVPFMLASECVGGPQTGWVDTAFLENLVHKPICRDLDVTAARAISGAAFAAAMGAQTRFFEVFLALTNVRLGAWLPNPWFVTLKSQNLDDWTIPGLPSRRRLSLLAREIFGIHPSWARMLLCTDGGHYDNLGLIELLRLRCKLIYCIDASGGGAPLADTLAGTLAVAREELGVDIKLNNPLALVPGGSESSSISASGPLASLHQRLSERAVIVGEITYPDAAEGAPKGTLIFAQADLTPGMPYQVLEYSQNDPGFPRDGTGDQWFNSGQFDVYQQLGRYLGQRAAETARRSAGVGGVARGIQPEGIDIPVGRGDGDTAPDGDAPYPSTQV
jgi:hypothetical protein